MPPPTTVVNCRREPYDVYIGRGSIWGNPWTHKNSRFDSVTHVKTRAEAIERYREWINSKPELIARLPELKGKRLGCFCKPLSCHGDILVEMIQEYC